MLGAGRRYMMSFFQQTAHFSFSYVSDAFSRCSFMKMVEPISSYLKSTLGFAMMGSQILSRRVGYNSCGFGPHGDAPWYPNLLRRVKQIKIQLMLKLMRTDIVLQESYEYRLRSVQRGREKNTF
uniref:Uncharacterized protein n=1 Tax=Populus trichocarpa TaxID=3694 RepID=A0A3N7FTI1_POPTR